MGKVKGLLMDSEHVFYDRALAAVNNSESSDEAVNTVIELAEQMELTDYLGGVDTIVHMTLDVWYDNNTSV